MNALYPILFTAVLLLSGCTPKLPAAPDALTEAYDELPDLLKFEHTVLPLTSDYTGAISLNYSRKRHNLSDEDLLAFQKLMEESEFFNHTTVYRDEYPSIFESENVYGRDRQIWVKRGGFPNTRESGTTVFTPVVFNRQPNAYYTHPQEIPFYAPFLNGEIPEPDISTISYVKYSSISKKPRQYMVENYKRGRHYQNVPYRLAGLFPREFNVIHREEIEIEYWKLSELFEKVWLHEFLFHVTDEETGSPVADAELVIHHFEEEGTKYGRFAHFSKTVSESPFAERYRYLYNSNDANCLVSHNLHSNQEGLIRLMVPVHPEKTAPALNYSIRAGGYTTFSAEDALLSERVDVVLGRE